jgi:hypothetical protein
MMEENKSITSQEEIFSPRNTININLDEETRNYEIFKTCFKCIFKILISAGLSVWFILAIIALSNEKIKDINQECPNSRIWPCLCTMVGICGISLIFESRSNVSKNKNLNIWGLCLNIACFIWMTIEIFDNCAKNNLTNYEIYKLLFIFYWIYVGGFCLLFILCICMCCNLCLNENVEDGSLEKPIVNNFNFPRENNLDI